MFGASAAAQKLAAEQEGHVRRLAAAYERLPASRGRRDEPQQPDRREGTRAGRSRPTSAPPKQRGPAVQPPQDDQQVGVPLLPPKAALQSL